MPLRLPLACLLLALVITACGGEDQTPRPKPPGPRLTTDLARVLDMRLREGVADAGIPGASAAIVSLSNVAEGKFDEVNLPGRRNPYPEP
jgi:hypothetical protein